MHFIILDILEIILDSGLTALQSELNPSNLLNWIIIGLLDVT